jgi:hypothetical protein
MTKTFQARFDGKAILPETPVDLPQNQRLTVTVESQEADDDPEHGTVAYVVQKMKGHEISDEDAALMRAAIEENCERIPNPPNVDFDASDRGHERRD